MLAKIEQLLQEIEGLQAANAEELEALRLSLIHISEPTRP